MSADAPVVVKVGGSLFDLPDLAVRLRTFLSQLGTDPVLLVPGGGPTADAIRTLDRTHHLGEEAAHWLALHALAVNAHFLKSVLPGSQVVASPVECPALWSGTRLPILDAHAFALAEDAKSGRLPHCWEVTSDSVAARVAVVAGARRLILLKSIAIPPGTNWAEAGRHGWVDNYFGAVVRDSGLIVEAINLRQARGEH